MIEDSVIDQERCFGSLPTPDGTVANYAKEDEFTRMDVNSETDLSSHI